MIGFIIQNLTEGLGIVVPLIRERPSLKSLVVLGLIAGGPAILGTWVGGLFSSPVLSVLFLGVGSGAVFQVAYQIGRRLVWPAEQRRQMPGVCGGVGRYARPLRDRPARQVARSGDPPCRLLPTIDKGENVAT